MSKMSPFFDETKEQSLVKATIVSKYLWAWAKVVIPWAKRGSSKIAYIDLFAGPGRYKDGTKSTPLLVLERAVEDTDMCQMLVTIFNDANADHSCSLEKAIHDLPGIEKLTYQPRIYNEEVGSRIVQMFETMRLVPALFFVDPWGYKGLSLRLINAVLKGWGCDCIFFFNYNRINMGLGNETVREHMNALFGEQRADELRKRLQSMGPQERELAIVEEIAQALTEMGGNYVLPFCFKNEMGTRTSHHLIFVCKNIRGYQIMKEIMAKESSSTEQGVPSFEFNPATERQPLLFELSRPRDELEGMLLDDFAGCTMSMEEVYGQHHVGRRYIKSNYKQALMNLESQAKILTDPPADERPQRKGEVTFADRVMISFPAKDEQQYVGKNKH